MTREYEAEGGGGGGIEDFSTELAARGNDLRKRDGDREGGEREESKNQKMPTELREEEGSDLPQNAALESIPLSHHQISEDKYILIRSRRSKSETKTLTILKPLFNS